MQDILRKIYNVFRVVFVALFFILFFAFGLNIVEKDSKKGYEVLTTYTESEVVDKKTPLGVKFTYDFELKDVDGRYCTLLVYSKNQDVTIYLDGTRVYRMKADDAELAGNSPGYVWNEVMFQEKDNGKMVRVEIAPLYESASGIRPILYFGSVSDIIRGVLWKRLPSLIMTMVTILVGILYIAFILCNYKKPDVERKMLGVGGLILEIGFYKLADTDVVSLLFHGHPIIAQMPHVFLMFICGTIMLVIKEMYSSREHLLWYLPCVYGICNMTVTFLRQYLDIADIAQMIWATGFNMLIILVVIVIMTIHEHRTVGVDARLKRNLCGIAGCLIAEGIDQLIYFAYEGQVITCFSVLAIMAYSLNLGYGYISALKNLLIIGAKAQRYEKMAYHDQLTGLYNRMAFAEHTSDPDFVAERCIVVVMDLNNLKTCNDKMGHDKGDIYIRESSRMIKESFEDIGRCYRMGGDEFYVLLENGSPAICQQRLKQLKERVGNCDKVGDGFRMGIACGFKVFDRLVDNDIHETARRADNMMYQDKFAMKEL